ncbi:response regulator [Pricia sp. S334]|uniref:Response regulator n=1 Tax=Pricia mediterranea TaxID=3076079 RepID=A0ABU3L022_9FLAO|nr:response regulator [Pricia sp. S334]MDT7827084.1 response regulator [Pricia sp. S334]
MPLEIWIIDDDLVSLYATRYRIDQANVNAKVLDFDNAEIALNVYLEKQRTEQNLPDIILLDLVMPEMCGWRFLEEIDKVPETRKKPEIYVLSAFSNSKDRKRAKDHGAIHGHFDKPLSKLNMEKMLIPLDPRS